MPTGNMSVPADGFLEFSPGRLTPTGYIALGSYLLVAGVGAITLNFTSLLMFFRYKKLRAKPHNLLLINLAFCDLSVSLIGYPMTTASSFAQRWLFGSAGCYFQGFFTFFLSLCSMYTLTAVSVYRYIALCKPDMNYKLSKSFTIKLIAGVWATSLIFPVMPLLGWTGYTLEPYGTSCSIDWTSQTKENVAYICLCIVFCYVTTVVIMGFSYCKMIQRHLSLQRAISSSRNDALCLREASCIHNIAAENKVTVVVLVMVMSFVLIWSPYTWVGLWTTLVGTSSATLLSLPSMMAKTSPLINPLIYIVLSPEFRKKIPGAFKRNLRVHVTNHRVATTRSRNVFHVDRTNDGIYTGTVAIEFYGTDTTMF